jgi:aminoglycoside phosphotransferase (APT) family kinase protein
MNDQASSWYTTMFAMVGHPHEAKVLMQPADAGYTLPGFQLTHEEQWLKQQAIVDYLQAEVGAALFLLRWICEEGDEEARRFEAVLEMELLAPLAKSDLQWVGAADLVQLTLARPGHRPLIERFLAEQTSGVLPPERSPWARRGWHAQVQPWIREQVGLHAGQEVTTIELVRVWDLSCVLRARAANGEEFYFKATTDLPLFVNETIFTLGLATLYPAYIPHPFAVETDRQWMLLERFEGEIEWEAPLVHRERLVSTFAAVQIDSIQHVDQILAFGALDRRLAWTAAQIDRIFAGLDGLDLAQEEIEQLRQLAPFLKERCQQVSTYNVPPALVHGDLHCGNVAFRQDGLTIFDWTDVCVTHPFFDMFIIYREEDSAVQERLRDLYLSAWRAFEPLDRLHELWTLAKPIFALHHTISYWTITRHGESTDLISDFAEYARLLVCSVEEDARIREGDD